MKPKDKKDEPSLDDVIQQYNQISERAAKDEETQLKAREKEQEDRKVFESEVKQAVALIKTVFTKVAANFKGGTVDETPADITVYPDGSPQGGAGEKGKQLISLTFIHPKDTAKTNGSPHKCRLTFYMLNERYQRQIHMASATGWLNDSDKTSRYVARGSCKPGEFTELAGVEALIASTIKPLLRS
jgi:hypothetical protein